MSNIPLTFIAKWQANPYTLTLNENNGAALTPNTQIVTFNSSYKLPVTTRTGYDFDGWYLGENGSGTKITDKDGNCLDVWSIANDTNLYAKWNVTVYTISYTLSDGVIVGTNPRTYTIEDLDIVINNPTKSGYDYTGWVGTDIEDKTMNLTIPAGSVGNRTYGATYEENSSFVAISNATEFLAIKDNLAGNYNLTIRGGSSFIGVLVGYNTGNVYNCNSSGSVGKLNGKFSALVYENLGVVKNCYSLGTFEQSEASIGAGLIAINYGEIINSYSLCSFNIEAYGSMYVGGLCVKN